MENSGLGVGMQGAVPFSDGFEKQKFVNLWLEFILYTKIKNIQDYQNGEYLNTFHDCMKILQP